MIRRQDGFTLVEMIVVSAIVTIVFLALFLLWDAGWSTLETAQAQAIVNQELRKGVDCLVSEVTEAGVSTIVGVPADDTWYGSLTFQTATDVVGGSTVWSADQIVYALGGTENRQLLRMCGDAVRVVANNIESFAVRRLSTDPAMTEIAVRSKSTTRKGHDVEEELNVKVRVRN